MISKAFLVKNLAIAISLGSVLTLAGCSGQTLGVNNLSPGAKADVLGAGTGILAGAAGGALVGAAIVGAPGLGAGVGALIGAGAGWAVASESQSVRAQLAETQTQVKQQQDEIEENRRALASGGHHSAGQPANRQVAQEAVTQPYTVKPGDTLSAIAKLSYGKANQYTRIFQANEPMLRNPNRIYPGQVLRIPLQA